MRGERRDAGEVTREQDKYQDFTNLVTGQNQKQFEVIQYQLEHFVN